MNGRILAKELRLVEVLRNPGNGAIRAAYVFDDLDILVVVKVFDPKGDDNYSIKFYLDASIYVRVKSFWRSQEVLGPEATAKWDKTARYYVATVMGAIFPNEEET